MKWALRLILSECHHCAVVMVQETLVSSVMQGLFHLVTSGIFKENEDFYVSKRSSNRTLDNPYSLPKICQLAPDKLLTGLWKAIKVSNELLMSKIIFQHVKNKNFTLQSSLLFSQHVSKQILFRKGKSSAELTWNLYVQSKIPIGQIWYYIWKKVI